MTIKAMHLLHYLVFTALILTLLTACQSGPLFYGQPTYVPTPTFPPFPPTPQPTPTLMPSSLPIATPAPNPQIVTHQKQVDGKNLYTMDLKFPYLEQAPDPRFDLFNREVDKVINSIQQDFLDNLKKSPVTPDPNMPPSFLGSDYKITHGNAGLLSVLFSIDFYMAGAAHPNQYARTLNLNITDGKVLNLADLFNPGADYLKVISDYCIQDLKNQGRLETESGALPNADNYRSWNITPQGLLISFDPYQVIAYAMGPQAVTIPYASLKQIINISGPLSALLQ
jgi:hypothetical protein